MPKPADTIIREAMERGEFNDLKNKGKPLNLDDYFDTPEDLRMAYSVLKSADVLPEEVQMLKEIETLEEKLKRTKNEQEAKTIRSEIETRRLKYNLLMDRRKNRRI